MKEKNEFDILENTEQSVIDRISEEFPPDDAEEKENIFRMSIEKSNKASRSTSKFTENGEQTVSGVEVYKPPIWKKCLSAAAAAVILLGGAAGGIKAYKYFMNAHVKKDDPVTEENTTNDNIISDDENIEEPTEALISGCPFDFAAHEFIRPDPDSRKFTFVSTGKSEAEGGNGETSFNLYDGNIIPLEKRQQLADFFSSCKWEEINVPDYPPTISGSIPWEDTYGPVNNCPFFLYTYERFCFYSLSDGEFNMLGFDGDQDTLTVTSFMIEPKYDVPADDPEQIVAHYIAADENLNINDITKCYKIDFSFFLSRIKEILGENFRDISMDQWGFLGKEWSVISDENSVPAELSETDKRKLCSILKKGCWKEESRDSKTISAEEEKELYKNTPPPESDRYVVLTGKLCDYNYVICLEEYSDKIIAKYYDSASNISGDDYTEDIYTYSCDDTSLISSVKEYLRS